jgi:hypothetical protein
MSRSQSSFLSGVCLVAALLVASTAFASPLGEACQRDLDFLPEFLAVNDAGGRDLLARHGRVALDQALASARELASQAESDEQCLAALRGYLAAWRKGHLAVRAIAPSPAAPSNTDTRSRVPSIKTLSPSTALITIPSFGDPYRAPLAALLKQHRSALAARRNWIIDVRGNGGGSDSTYQALLPWLLPNGWVEVSAQWLVTPENIDAHQRACAMFAPGDAECTKFMNEAVRRMQGAPANTFVEQEDGNGWNLRRPETVEPRRPQRVVVLIDNQCGSSCEEFVLTVRQSFSVKLVGRSSTMGVLDYSNMRPRDLPSGQRRLLYATSRSNRLPSFPIDGIGISPDIYLPGPAPADRAADVELARRAVERASWGAR